MRPFPGDLLEGIVYQSDRTGLDYPDMTRINRVRVYRRLRVEPPEGLQRGEFLHLIGARVEYDTPRRGLWLVLAYYMGAARYRVLHPDKEGQLHDVLINVGDLESDEQFRLVLKGKRS